jgi:hypothetical protein
MAVAGAADDTSRAGNGLPLSGRGLLKSKQSGEGEEQNGKEELATGSHA